MIDILADQIPLLQEYIEAVHWWLREDRWQSGVPLKFPPPSLSLYTDTSVSGWGTHLLDLTASRVWSEEESLEHISVLKMKAVALALAAFLAQLSGQSVILMSDNASVVVYLRHQGGTVSRTLSHGLRDHHVDRAAFGSLISKVHFGEEKHSG